MSRSLKVVLTASIALLVVPPIISTYWQVPGTVAYAQGPFRNKRTGGDDQDKQSDEAKKQEDAKKAEDTRKAQDAADKQRQADAQKEAQRLQDAADQQKREKDAARAADEAKRVEAARKAQEVADRQKAQQDAADQLKRETDAARAADEARRIEDARRAQDAADQQKREIDAQRKAEDAQRQADSQDQQPQVKIPSSNTSTGSQSRTLDPAKPVRPKNQQTSDRIPTGSTSGHNTDDRTNKAIDRDTSKYTRPEERPKTKPNNHKHRNGYDPYVYDGYNYPSEHYPYDPSRSGSQPPIVIYVPVPVDTQPSQTTSAQPTTADGLPIPTTPEQALDQIRQAWMEKNPKLLLPLLQEDTPIKIYDSGELARDMSAQEFYSVTSDAIGKFTTEVFWLKSVKNINGKVYANGVHTYYGADGKIERSDINYTLVLRSGRWFIAETGFADPDEQLVPAKTGQNLAEQMLISFAQKVAMSTTPDPTVSVLAILSDIDD